VGRIFDREIVVNAGGLRIASRSIQGDPQPTLRVQFRITRSLKKDPNTATLAFYNLKKSNRAQLQEKGIPTVIEAGYADNISQIFGGQLQFGSSIKNDTDWVSTIQTGDGANPFKISRINKSLKGPIQLSQVLDIAGQALGVNLGNLRKKVAEGGLRAGLKEFTHGISLSGKAEQVFSKLAKAYGVSWSIQDGQLLLLGPKETIDQTAVVLKPGTGLVGSPEPGEKGIVKARALLQPDLVPGRKVQIQSAEIDGFFRVEKVMFTGDSRGGDWYSDIEVKPI